MRKIIVVTSLAMIMSLALISLTRRIEGRASASNANSPLLAQGRATVSINDVSLTEGDAGTSNMVFVVTVTGSHTNTVGVDYATANGSATAPSDYISTSGQLVFPPGLGATTSITVPIVGDTSPESVETFFVNLSIVDSSAELADGQGVGTVHDNDGAPVLPALSIGDVSVNEGNTGNGSPNPSANFLVNLSGTNSSEVRVNYTTADGTATVTDGDYVSQSGTLVFPANDTTPKTISIQVLSDSRVEPNETFFLSLTNPTGATILDGQGVCTILDQDGDTTLPALSISDVFIQEDDSRDVAAIFEVRLSFASSSTVTVNYATADGTATLSGLDYNPRDGTLEFPPGDVSTKAISVRVFGDDVGEPNEIFFLDLSNAQGATIADGQGVCTIFNDDSPCAYSFSTGGGKLASQIFSATGGTATITITTEAGCPWAAFVAGEGSFVTLTSAFNGSGSGTLSYSVAPNSGPNTRTANILFGPSEQTFTVMQEGSDCPASAYTISPSAMFLKNEGEEANFKVDTPPECDWTVSTEDSWIDVRSPITRKGPGTVFFAVEPNESGLWRSGIINVAGKPFIVQQISSECVTEFLCTYYPRTCLISATNTLAASRSFRDRVLARTSRGKRYTELYYKFSTDFVGIMMLNPMLILRSRAMMERYMPVIQSLVNDEHVALTEGDIEEIDGFLRSFGEKGNAELKETVKGLCGDLRDPQVHREFNITVTKGSKRELPAEISLLPITLTGLMIAPFGLFFFCRHRKRPIRRKRIQTALRRLFCAAIVFSMVAGTGNPFVDRMASGHTATTHSTLSAAKLEKTKTARATETFGRHPLSFEPNHGQLDPRVKFVSRANGYNLYLTATEAVMAVGRHAGKEKGRKWDPSQLIARYQPPTAKNLLSPIDHEPPATDILTMKLLGANPDPRVRGIDELPGSTNYFIGDAAQWRANVPTYARVEYENVYEGIDLVYYGNGRELEYDFNVAPGAEPAAIRLAFEGAERPEIDFNGDLVLRVSSGEVRQRRPVAYQEINGYRRSIPSRYRALGDQASVGNPRAPGCKRTIGFEIGDYDKSRPLIIDPVLAYSTYFGGSGNEEGNSIAVDSAGNVYVTGFTDSINFPVTNASQPVIGGGQQDAFVAKLDPSGTRLLYSTYIGGSGQDNGTSIAVDSAGNAYITGFTDSTNFPVRNALQPTKKGSFNAFVVKLDAAGSMLNSTLFGGSISDFGSSIAVDSAGNTYVAGIATSPDFPMTSALQSTHGGLVDIYVAKIDSSGTRLVYSTYLGGIGIEGASSIALDPAGNIYLTGLTSSRNFRNVNPLQATHGGGVFDAFVTKLNPSGSQIIYSTYLGGSGEDRAFRIAVDPAGNAYVTGDTDSTDFPVARALQTTNKGSSDAFVTKLGPNGSALVYSTYLGGSGIEGGTAIAVDSGGGAYVTGFTGSDDFPTSPPLLRDFGGGGFDGFIMKLNSSGVVDYSTYLGGSGIDSAFSIAVDSAGDACVMGVTASTDFPTTNPLQPAFGGGTADLFIARIKPDLRVSGVMVDRKKLLVLGSGFDQGARILLNGRQQKTINDLQNPTTSLVGNKAGKKIAPGERVTIRVRNSDGTLSNGFIFTRSVQ